VNAIFEELDNANGLGVRLNALLITPVQRIPRYVLLLRELRNRTDPSHPDFALIQKAIPIIEEVRKSERERESHSRHYHQHRLPSNFARMACACLHGCRWLPT